MTRDERLELSADFAKAVGFDVHWFESIRRYGWVKGRLNYGHIPDLTDAGNPDRPHLGMILRLVREAGMRPQMHATPNSWDVLMKNRSKRWEYNPNPNIALMQAAIAAAEGEAGHE